MIYATAYRVCIYILDKLDKWKQKRKLMAWAVWCAYWTILICAGCVILAATLRALGDAWRADMFPFLILWFCIPLFACLAVPLAKLGTLKEFHQMQFFLVGMESAISFSVFFSFHDVENEVAHRLGRWAVDDLVGWMLLICIFILPVITVMATKTAIFGRLSFETQMELRGHPTHQVP